MTTTTRRITMKKLAQVHAKREKRQKMGSLEMLQLLRTNTVAKMKVDAL